MEKYNKNTVSEYLMAFDPSADKDDFIEVSEWKNGEGYDITIISKFRTMNFCLTLEELDAINYLTKTLELR